MAKMGSGAAKQPQTKKIYVKSKEDATCDDQEYRVSELVSATSSAASLATYDEQMKLIKSGSEQHTWQIPPLPPLQHASSPAGDDMMAHDRPVAAVEAQELSKPEWSNARGREAQGFRQRFHDARKWCGTAR